MLKKSFVLKLATASALALGPAIVFAGETIQFLQESYTESYSSSLAGSSIHEFTRAGENLNSWGRLLTIQCHPSATRLAEVVNPYLASRKDSFLAKPAFIHSPGDGDSGLALVAVLGQKGGPTFEFVVARFAEQNPGVITVVMSEGHKTEKRAQIESGKAIEAEVLGFDMKLARRVCSENASPAGSKVQQSIQAEAGSRLGLIQVLDL